MRDGGGEFGLEWEFYLKFAAFCVSRSEVSNLLEEVQPSELGRTRRRRLGVVERLLVLLSTLVAYTLSCDGVSTPT
jgi:hypothetical protein